MITDHVLTTVAVTFILIAIALGVAILVFLSEVHPALPYVSVGTGLVIVLYRWVYKNVTGGL